LAKDMCSVRLARLNQLVMEFYKVSNPTREHLYYSLGYRCARTLERDLKYLREQYGVDIRFTRSSMSYHLEGMGTFLVNLQLSEREVTSLAAGLRMASHFLPHLSGSCENMWAKIQMVIPETLADQGRKLAGSAVVALPVSRMDPGVFETLIGAISNRRTVRFRYRSPYSGGKAKDHDVSPWGVFFRAHAWYLWGFSSRRRKPVTFRVSRIARVSAFDITGYIPPGEEQDVVSYAASAWYACSGEGLYDIRIRVRQPLGSVVEETVWHPSQKITRENDGAITLRACVPELGDVARWVMASAPYAEVLEPALLREQVEQLGEGVATVHS